ncbi:molybdenum cofactor cytidylyltransferase [Anaerolineae bacterium]|nr:molybdenum cofactor cytidylyltransferase [Anaerolineae bacterium]
MRLENIPLDQAVGAILVHNIVGADGRKAFSKGRVLTAEDVEKIRALGKATVNVAMLDPDDVREDDAAARLARAVAGDGVELSKPSGGRVNLYATTRGFLRVNRDALNQVNELNGVTLATISRFAPVAPRKMIATLKTIGLALPDATVRAVEEIGAVTSVAPVINRRAAIILTGSANGRARVEEIFVPPIRARLEELGAQIVSQEFVAEEENAIADAIADAIARAGAQLIVIAGETSIMDAEDVTPRGITRAGGVIELYGAPVEPGNLLLLAYRGAAPIIGAPGCIKSRATNVVDLILPRLLAGERVTRADVIALAEGGLLVG